MVESREGLVQQEGIRCSDEGAGHGAPSANVEVGFVNADPRLPVDRSLIHLAQGIVR